MTHKAKRYNKGKIRFELIPSDALSKVAEVYTRGAHKYSVYENIEGVKIKGSDIPFEELGSQNLKMIEDGADNWRLGQNWLGMMASVKRHITDWERGEDIDPDPAMQTYHLANAVWGLLGLLSYYNIYPEGDDRKLPFLNNKKIGLDIDEVLADFVGAWLERFGINELPHFWNFDKEFKERLEEVKDDKDFWMNIKPLIKPEDLNFEPHCYITSRIIPTEWTEEWLSKWGFPSVKVYTVGVNKSKVEAAKESGIEVFVDDRFENFLELTSHGIFTYLMTTSHNKKYNVGHRRINSLTEIFKK